jgi:hypothetical protein
LILFSIILQVLDISTMMLDDGKRYPYPRRVALAINVYLAGQLQTHTLTSQKSM